MIGRTGRALGRWLRTVLPGATMLGGAAFLAERMDTVVVQDLVSTYGLVIVGAGLALAWIFHRSRAFLALLLLAGLGLLFVRPEVGSEVRVQAGTAVIALLGLLSLFRDRGVTSRVGLLQALVVIGLAGGLSVVLLDPARRAALLAWLDVHGWGALTPLGYPRDTIAVGAVALLFVGWGVVRHRGPVERGLAWSLASVALAVHPATPVSAGALYLLAGALCITVAIVETSWVMAYRDDLTGLPGRRALTQALDGMKGGTYTVAMVDVDHFKKFNDRYGHDVGDQVLRLVASRLGRAPGGGKAYRYGGEEFTLLFPGRTAGQTTDHLEAVRRAVADARFSLRSWKRPRKKPRTGSKGTRRPAKEPRKLSVTVSVGAADSASTSGGAEAVLKRADEALYRAKRSGRNRVSISRS